MVEGGHKERFVDDSIEKEISEPGAKWNPLIAQERMKYA